jgi:Acetoacetate decarboxylase (ADC)
MTAAPYISWIGHGAANITPPDTFTGATMNLFGIATNMAAVQKLVDALLNPAGGGHVRYAPALPVAIFSFSDSPECTSLADPIGFISGREAMILVPLWEYLTGRPVPRLVFWAPYIFIDYTIGLVTGREVWGWPKVLARIGVAIDGRGADFSCQTTIFPVLTPSTPAQDAVLYRVVKAQAGAVAPPWTSAAEAALGALEGLLGGLAEDVLRTLALQPQIECVVLKQFRTSDDPKVCCYQAIVNSPIALTGFRGGGPLFDRFTVEITSCESHAIVCDLLGKAPNPGSTSLPVTFAVWAAVDYAALPGAAVVVAT